MDDYKGRRFAAFISICGLLFTGFLVGPAETFGTFATTIGIAFSVYVGGQSATDWKETAVEGKTQ